MENTTERERRQYTSFNHRSRFGKSSVDIECPFCRAITTAFIWSLSGSGKKCTCGALHGGWGFTLAPIEKVKKGK